MLTFVQVLDFIGTFAFAISGIRLASAKQFDWFGAYEWVWQRLSEEVLSVMCF